MRLNYIYRKTPAIAKYLQSLEVARRVIEAMPILPAVVENLRRKSLLKSSLFSARIEGNRLTMEDIKLMAMGRTTKQVAKIEIFNILTALRLIHSGKLPRKLNGATMLKLHRLVMAGIADTAGRWRSEPGAIFNQAGVAVYLAPPPNEIPPLIDQLVKWGNTNAEPALIKAAWCHLAFEKIHPLEDGNGRVGRLVATLILKNSGFGFGGLVSLEEYLDQHRQIYYDLLAAPSKDITGFIEFFLEALNFQADKAIGQLRNSGEESGADSLLPRRAEILATIKDHRLVSFDFMRRRFYQMAVSTLHYDLQQLIKAG